MKRESSLNSLSEMIALSAYGNTKNLIITGVDITGNIDKEAVMMATQMAASKYPQFAARLKEERRNLQHRLVWDTHENFPVPVFFSEMNGSSENGVLEGFLDHLSPRLNRNWDLFKECPAEVHLVRVAKNHFIWAPIVHHAVADGATASEFGRQLLAEYQQITKGHEPNWAHQTHAMSTTKKRQVEPKKKSFRDFIQSLKDAVSNTAQKPILPVGQGIAGDLRQFHIKRILSAEDTSRVIVGAIKRGVSPVDLLAASMGVSIDRWNNSRGISPGTITTSMSVNMKGRFGELEGGNTSGLIFFTSQPEQRRDMKSFARSIAVQRIRRFRNQKDFTFFRNVSGMTSLVNLLPFRARQRIVSLVMNLHRFSAAVTFLGTIWPVSKNGKLTLESNPTQVADLTINEVHGLGYKLLSETKLLLIAYTFREKLNLVLAVSGSLFNRNEAESFADMLVSTVQEFT
ncbi:condensation domain-containing protein [Desulfomonile tiedjei]|uniref:Putative polyketide synthase component n=1 Tax=Desulfomonile tiedjei (strain ATCC 49306 / DSM 6799 / DCB-1) TaxID=706587 RepID=I4C740_DESTA|nr:condensation domain-containing protein [Desulfomonile tiedjei]AFM25381.1 putative polyketide synthase component [Desulfomonile tiedjei DSM 6799]